MPRLARRRASGASPCGAPQSTSTTSSAPATATYSVPVGGEDQAARAGADRDLAERLQRASPRSSKRVTVPDQRLLTAARLPSGEQATPAGLRPQGCSARTLPASRSTSETESAVWLAVSARPAAGQHGQVDGAAVRLGARRAARSCGPAQDCQRQRRPAARREGGAFACGKPHHGLLFRARPRPPSSARETASGRSTSVPSPAASRPAAASAPCRPAMRADDLLRRRIDHRHRAGAAGRHVAAPCRPG